MDEKSQEKGGRILKYKDKIRLHLKGKYDLSTELVNLALSSNCVTTTMVSTEHSKDFYNGTDGHYSLTFTRWRPTYKPAHATFEYRLAYNFRTLLTRHAKPANAARKKWLFEIDNQSIYDYDALGMIYETLKGIGHEYFKDDFDNVTESMLDMVAAKYGSDHFIEFIDELKEFQKILPYINRQKKKYYQEMQPLMIAAINETLPKVDLNRSDDDIVAFIAKGVRWGTYKKLNELYGSHTFDVGGEKYYVLEIDMKWSSADKLVWSSKEKLTKSQSEFMEKLRSLIKEEVNNRNIKVFTFDPYGQIIKFQRRYFAEKMGLEESAFKKRLDRLQKPKTDLISSNKNVTLSV